MKIRDIYRCKICKLQLEVTAGNCEHPPVCCGVPMELQAPNTVDAAKEKHVPVIVAEANGPRVKVGSIPHPATAEHYIEWISLQTKNGNQRRLLTPNQKPEVTFALCEGDEVEIVYAYCNLHSLWKAE